MSHQEFENYLTLLTRLLKVAPAQREQMAQEFRAHLEDRLDELLASGIDKNQAVQQAIGEFGDAAALAAELAQIAQRRRRRLIMRMSYAGVAALALAGLLTLALWPEGRQVPGPKPAVAQGTGAVTAASPDHAQVDVTLDKTALANKKIEELLDKPAEFDFVDTPLKDVVGFLATNYRINVVLRKSALADAAINEDTPVTSSLRQISLRSALRIMFRDLRLDYVIQDEVLQITTPEDAESVLTTRVYDCRELLALPDPPGSMRTRRTRRTGLGGEAGSGEAAPQGGQEAAPATAAGGTPAAGAAPKGEAAPMGGGGSGFFGGKPKSEPKEKTSADLLIELITTTVTPDSWDEVGGPGAVAEYKGLLVVTQTGEIHEKVERLLNMLHKSAGLKEQRVKVVE